MTLDIKGELSRVHELYKNDSSFETFNALLYGKCGSGKTTILATCRKPVLIHCFDPHGTLSIRSLLGPEKGIFVENFVHTGEGPDETFKKWQERMKELDRDKRFEALGTFAIDSFTTWCQSLIQNVLQTAGTKRNRPDIPAMADYQIIGVMVRDRIKRCTTLPCDFVLTAHIASERDEITGGIENTLAAIPSLREQLPLLFDEVYVLRTKVSSAGTQYFLQTQNDGIYLAKTRLGANSKFQKEEPQNMKELLKKAGLSVSDKEWK